MFLAMGKNDVDGGRVPVEYNKDYVPPMAQVVSPEILAQVFEDEQLPFKTNADGSVDMDVYMAWLQRTHQAALKAFDDESEFEVPSRNQGPSAQVF